MAGATPVSLGDKIVIDITGVSHDGAGIGRYQGFAIFVPGALPGERAEVLISGVKKTFAAANLLKTLRASPYRSSPLCPLYGQCGGCQLQHAEYPEQLTLKQAIVENALTRIGRFAAAPVLPVIGMDWPWRYRNRAQFHFQYRDGRLGAGFFTGDSQKLISVGHCYLLPDIFNQVAAFITERLDQTISGLRDFEAAGLAHLVMKISHKTKELAIVFVVDNEEDKRTEELTPLLMARFPQIAAVDKNINRSQGGGIFGPVWRHLGGKNGLCDTVGGHDFEISAAAFVQVNPEQTEILYGKVMQYADLKGEETAIDVYCGIGTISLMLAERCHKVYGIEEYPAAVGDAKKNAACNKIANIEFLAGKAEEVLPAMCREGIKPDLIVVDPPRGGCAAAVLAAMAAMAPSRIVYVSCDPGTLARDLRILGGCGYQISKVQPVDMFPQTFHVETVALMSRVEK